jgi:hypothetical protein
MRLRARLRTRPRSRRGVDGIEGAGVRSAHGTWAKDTYAVAVALMKLSKPARYKDELGRCGGA